MSDMTVEDYRLRCEAKEKAKQHHPSTRPPQWECIAEDRTTYSIRSRTDRSPLISLYKGSAQVCQLP